MKTSKKGKPRREATPIGRALEQFNGSPDSEQATHAIQRYVAAELEEQQAIAVIAAAQKAKSEAVADYLAASGETGNIEITSLGVVKPAYEGDLLFFKNAATARETYDV